MTDFADKELLKRSLDLMVLSTLSTESKYGYLIQKDVRSASGGRAVLPAGTLYPLLHRLESEKAIRSRWESDGGRRRKWYELTAAGKKRLQKQAEQWTTYADCIRRMLESAAILPPEPTPRPA